MKWQIRSAQIPPLKHTVVLHISSKLIMISQYDSDLDFIFESATTLTPPTTLLQTHNSSPNWGAPCNERERERERVVLQQRERERERVWCSCERKRTQRRGIGEQKIREIINNNNNNNNTLSNIQCYLKQKLCVLFSIGK